MLTKVYLDFQVLKVVNNEKSKNEDKEIIALPIGHDPINLTDECKIKYYNNIEPYQLVDYLKNKHLDC
ncbi:hypothetical protein, partial [uncultured Haemophilus sp.]|uniref:hypothetical protein n=1 Tax=uncultured Haemophilus sp. TaxID=237779 RepID=UPI0025D96A96